MKAIILISSIFYILGLKVGNNIHLTPDSTSVKQVIPISMQENNQKNIKELNNKNNLILSDSLNTNQNINKLKEISK